MLELHSGKARVTGSKSSGPNGISRSNAGQTRPSNASSRWAGFSAVNAIRSSAGTASGLPISGENRATGSTAVRLHNSPKEVGDLASEFLLDFSKQLDPAVVMRNFTPTCPGTADELGDVRNNQANFLITSYTVGTPATRADFTGTCPFRNRFGDACAIVPVACSA